METLYEYLLDNYKENEPIFLADLQVDGMTRTNVRQQIKKLTDTGKVKRFDKLYKNLVETRVIYNGLLAQ